MSSPKGKGFPFGSEFIAEKRVSFNSRNLGGVARTSAQDALRVGAGDDEQRLALTIRLVDSMLDRIALLRIQRCERVQGGGAVGMGSGVDEGIPQAATGIFPMRSDAKSGGGIGRPSRR